MTLPGLDVSTPLMQQYREIKARYRHAIVLFRMGDFYETFEDDAEVAARTLGLTLTSRNNGAAAEIPLAGVPVKAAQGYIKKLVERGFRVAICEQVEDPRTAKGIVKREVIEVVTPGAALADDLLESRRNTWIVAIAGESGATGLAAIDLSTGEFVLERVAGAAELDATLARFGPAEVVVAQGAAVPVPGAALITRRDPWEFDPALAAEELKRRFALGALEGLGIEAGDAPSLGAAGALLRYLAELQPSGVPQLQRPVARRRAAILYLDAMTRRNLEIVDALHPGGGPGGDGTLLGVLDRTATAMGARLMRQWLLAPLAELEPIRRRHDAVAELLADEARRTRLREALDGVRDLERLGAKAAARRATPRDMSGMRASLQRLPAARAAIGPLYGLGEGFDVLEDLAADLAASLADELPATLGDGDVIRPGADAALDERRALRDGGRSYIAGLQARERARTGIASLKVGYNRVFGYFIEITRSHKDRVPPDYERRQTLTGAERYVTPELKEYEARVLGAEEEVARIEERLFGELVGRIGAAIARVQDTAARIAQADVLAAFAEAAAQGRYARPTMTADDPLDIAGCRHPVVERMMPRESFIPNDIALGGERQIMIVTGPNMAGKSTVLRQTGLAIVMAQAGSFVPAAAATIGVVDRLFTRVGASDDLARGQSTFMVEMSETAAILHNATSRSLVLLDEIGRGTSTYDGVAIAWSVVEYLHERGPKTIFATHYHELTQLAERLPRVFNCNVAVHESGDDVVFLHRLKPGGADRSYGIHVARLAGLPESVIAQARQVLARLEAGHRVAQPLDQLGLFAAAPPAPEHPALAELRALDVDGLTPRDALARLAELQARAREDA